MQCINWFGGAAGKRDALLHGAYGLGPNKKMMLKTACVGCSKTKGGAGSIGASSVI